MAERSAAARAADRSVGATRDAVMADFASLMRHVAGWHVPDFLGIDVTMSQAKALYLVRAQPSVGMSALAAQLHVGPSAVSSLVDRLVEHGYVERREDPADRRQLLLTVTDAGAAVVDRLREMNERHMRSLLAGLTRHELESLRTGIAALEREARAIDRERPSS